MVLSSGRVSPTMLASLSRPQSDLLAALSVSSGDGLIGLFYKLRNLAS
jgi:hypothetical protein